MSVQNKADKYRKIKKEKRWENHWQGIGDAETLARAKQIRNDPEKLEEALAWAIVLSSEEKEQAQAFQDIANEA